MLALSVNIFVYREERGGMERQEEEGEGEGEEK